MIKFILMASVIIFNLTAQSVVQTDAHTYIVGKKEGNILVLDRESQKSKIIVTEGELGPVLIHGDYGYVTWTKDSEKKLYDSKVIVIDLRTNTPVKLDRKFEFITNGQSLFMAIHGDVGYVLNPYYHTVTMIDLNKNTVIKTIAVDSQPQHMVFYGDLGYVMNTESNTVSVLDLMTNTVIKSISVARSPVQMVIHEDLGYVVSSYSNNVSVIDLKTNIVIQTIAVGGFPLSMVIHGDLGYVVNSSSKNISVLDLKTNTVIQTIPVGYAEYMVIHDDFGYVVGGSEVFLIDLKANAVIGTRANLSEENINFSDTDIYFGTKKVGSFTAILELFK